ncbi:MAG: sigma 54-interacting transcriptional regulator [Desulfotignum sp.]|nr:sigma 54-interacting transcriptional regulator [Desulfotignum sp.]
MNNLIANNRLRDEKRSLEREKHYLMGSVETYRLEDFCYASLQMTEIMGVVKRVAKVDAPVFITGETGTGKDFLARFIHHASPRKDHMFVKVNCPALTPTLFESELFGHARGHLPGRTHPGSDASRWRTGEPFFWTRWANSLIASR